MACIRCGSDNQIERHHIVMKAGGGSDDEKNLEDRCRACHDFVHTWREIMGALEYERQRGQQDRIRVYEHRLQVLEDLNSPEIVRDRGTYVSYWTDNSTHRLPRRIPTAEEAEFDRLMQRNMEEWLREQREEDGYGTR